MRLAIGLVVLDALFLASGVGLAQNAGQPAAKSEHPNKFTLTECEGGDKCGVWTFLWSNGKGYGKWRNGEEAVLEMTTTAEEKVVIQRSDVTGEKEGLTATYEGVLSNNQLGGTVKYTYKGQTLTGFWNATVEAEPTSLPPVLHFCAANCMTLTLQNGRYVMTSPRDSWVPSDFTSIWTVESFTQQSVILNRHDSANPANAQHPNGWDITYRGRVSPDGNHLVNVDGSPMTINLAWGAAVNSVPGCNAQRDGTGTCQRSQSSPAQSGIDGNGIADEFFKGAAHEFGKDLMEAFLKSLSQQ